MKDGISREMVDDVFSVIEQEGRPILVSILMDSLRHGYSRRAMVHAPESGRRWRIGSTTYGFESLLQDAGFVIKSRKHGSGNAFYAGILDFKEVFDERHHKMVPVS